MASHIQQLVNKKLINDAPTFLAGAVQYEVVMAKSKKYAPKRL
jgi:hypothetical protein